MYLVFNKILSDVIFFKFLFEKKENLFFFLFLFLHVYVLYIYTCKHILQNIANGGNRESGGLGGGGRRGGSKETLEENGCVRGITPLRVNLTTRMCVCLASRVF